jgi:hypothetical protein
VGSRVANGERGVVCKTGGFVRLPVGFGDNETVRVPRADIEIGCGCVHAVSAMSAASTAIQRTNVFDFATVRTYVRIVRYLTVAVNMQNCAYATGIRNIANSASRKLTTQSFKGYHK